MCRSYSSRVRWKFASVTGSTPWKDAALEEWDAKVQHKLPYAIVVTMEYYVTPPSEGRNREPPSGKVRRIVLLTPARSVPPDVAAMDTGMTPMR